MKLAHRAITLAFSKSTFLLVLFLTVFSFLKKFNTAVIMDHANGHSVDNDTWESHNSMMLEPLCTNDPEVGLVQTFLNLAFTFICTVTIMSGFI